MIEDAEARGVWTKDKTIIETTSGNTGIGLAAIAATKNYKLRVYIQDSVSEERKKVIKTYSTEVVPFSDVPEMVAVFEENGSDFVETIKVFRETVVEQEENVVFLNQLTNDTNPNVHKWTTGVHRFSDADEARVPSNVHLEIFDEVLEVETAQAYDLLQTVRRTAENELSLPYPVYDIY